jgi:short-subunit dehydrogenase involved in D-alanine esterification of teichoic acids
VLVTGGATGLGEMAAQAFVQNGARVFIASRKESELKKVRCFRTRMFLLVLDFCFCFR